MFKNSQLSHFLPRKGRELQGPIEIGLSQTFDLMNTDPQKPVCLVEDNSYSTRQNGVIDRMNEGVESFARELRQDRIAARRIRVAGFSFGGGLKAYTDGFIPAADFYPPVLSSTGETPMGRSLLTICDHIREFKEFCVEAAVECGVVEVLVITDGMPTDDAETLAAARQAMIEFEELSFARFHAYYVDGCDPSQINRVFPRQAEALSDAEIVPMFRSLSKSLRYVSRKRTERGYDLQAEIRRDLGGDRHV